MEKQKCERCGQELDRPIWLELDQRTNKYTDKAVPMEFSQGFFPFGSDCAKIVLGEKR